MRTLETVHVGDAALAALQRLRRRGQTLALVRDDSGDAVGLLREEDLLARLLGTAA
jgi:CBS domain containing-hemolysin-like protein